MLAGVEPVYETRQYADDHAVLEAVLALNEIRRHLDEINAPGAVQVSNMQHGGDRKSEDQTANLQFD